MLNILDYLPAKRKNSPSGWISFNAVCCQHNGNSQDRRQRGGLKLTNQGWSYHCFNCNYTASFVLGRSLSYKAKKLLTWFNVPERDIEMLNIESLRHRSIEGILDDRVQTATLLQGIDFEERDLPPAAELITPELPRYWNYIKERCVPDDYPLMTQIRTDGIRWTRPGVIVPFTYNNKIVGWTQRFLDNHNPRYLSEAQPGYVFGIDLQKPHWQHVLVMEGIFDALSVSGLAVMHSTVSDAQARLIHSLGREVTVVPDRDRAGLELVDRALELGWAVSIPKWQDCKDVNDAVKKYGRLATVLSIMQARETSRIKIELRKRDLAKQV